MRNELYADSRDELKWTVATSTALTRSCSIRWVVMHRPDIGQHGEGRETVPAASPTVTRFFQQERQLFENGTQRDLRRISGLCQPLGIAIDMNMEPYPAALNARLAYITAETDFLSARAADRRDVVLIDPDNGIGRSGVNGLQFHEDHVPLVWQALREGDTLAVIQFQHHEADWVQQRRQNLARLLGLSAAAITPHHWRNVCVYVAPR